MVVFILQSMRVILAFFHRVFFSFLKFMFLNETLVLWTILVEVYTFNFVLDQAIYGFLMEKSINSYSSELYNLLWDYQSQAPPS